MKSTALLFITALFFTLGCGKAPEVENRKDPEGGGSGGYSKALNPQCIGFYEQAIANCKVNSPGQNCCKLIRYQLPAGCSQRYFKDCMALCEQFAKNPPYDRRAKSYCYFSHAGGPGKKCRPRDQEVNEKNSNLPVCKYDSGRT